MVSKRDIRDALFQIHPNMGIAYFRRIEKKKFQDPRRVKIANSYPLSNEQKEQIDDLFVTNYGEKIDYVWHQNYAAHAGKFDYRFFPELLYIPEFEAFENQNRHAVAMMSDKNLLPLIAQSMGVKMPVTIVSCTNGVLRDNENKLITPQMAMELVRKEGGCFVKPSVDTGSGHGCAKIKDCEKIEFNYNTLKASGGGINITL